MGVFRELYGDGETAGYKRKDLAMLTLEYLLFDEVSKSD